MEPMDIGHHTSEDGFTVQEAAATSTPTEAPATSNTDTYILSISHRNQ
jgi:hypothetical protein